MYVSGKERKTHVFIAKQQNGKIVYVDPQTEDRVNIDRRLNLTAKGMTEISRQVYAYENIEFSESKIPNDFHALHCVNI